MNKLEINASRSNVRVTAEGTVAMVIALATIAASIGACLYYFLK